jgi:hypothetical protein
MLYLDSCVVVALLVPEPHSSRADSWMTAKAGVEIALSGWVEAEVAAALSAKARLGQLDPARSRNARAGLAALAASTKSLPIERRHFAAAARFAEIEAAKLRGGDALHLAIAADVGATLCTLDNRLAEACATVGVPFDLI